MTPTISPWTDLRVPRRRISGMRSGRPIAPMAIAAVLAAGCGSHAGRSAVRPLFSQPPSVGVACPTANSIACDRVGLAIWLRRPAADVHATIDGQRVRLHPPRSKDGYWEGYLQPAGLLHGPLRVVPDRGRSYWQGTHPRDAHLTIVITRAPGTTERASVTVPLRAGWG